MGEDREQERDQFGDALVFSWSKSRNNLITSNPRSLNHQLIKSILYVTQLESPNALFCT